MNKLQDGLAACLKNVVSDGKLVKGDAVLYTMAYFMCKSEAIKRMSDAKAVSDVQEQVIKRGMTAAELFMKSLVKISGDVRSYVKQKVKSQDEQS